MGSGSREQFEVYLLLVVVCLVSDIRLLVTSGSMVICILLLPT